MSQEAQQVEQAAPAPVAPPPTQEQSGPIDPFEAAMAALGEAEGTEDDGADLSTRDEGTEPEAQEAAAEEGAEEAEGEEADASPGEEQEPESERYARLVERERELESLRSQTEADYTQKYQELAQYAEEIAPIVNAMRSGDQLALMEAIGLDYEQATLQALSGKMPQKKQAQPEASPEVQRLMSEFNSLKSELEAERTTNQLNDALKNMEGIDAIRSVPGINDRIMASYSQLKEQGYSLQDTIQALNNSIVSDIQHFVEHSPAIRKELARLLREETAPGSQAQPANGPSANATVRARTITNDDAAEVGRDDMDMSDEARMRRAMEALA